MLFRSATSRNIFAIVGLGLATSIAIAGAEIALTYTQTKQANLDRMQAVANSTADDIQSDLKTAYQLVEGMDIAITSQRNAGMASREAVIKYMEDTLNRTPSAFGLSTGWDANAYDGKDAEFVDKPVHDATGRFLPYVYRNGDALEKAVLLDYEKPGIGDYYILPHTTGKPVLLEPYLYPVNGRNALLTTISLPVRADGKVVGYVGADFDLANKAAELASKRPFGDGYIALVSAKGAVVSHPDSDLMGKPLADSNLDKAAWARLIEKPGTPMEIREPDGTTNLAVAVPVKPFEGATWFTVVSVPKATVFAELNQVLMTAAAIILAAALILILAGWFIARRFIGRIANVIDETSRIAAGGLNVDLKDRDRKDEIGDLSRSLAILLDNNRRKAELEREAEDARSREEAERGERSAVNAAREESIRFAVTELGEGLSRLSNGDVTVRLERQFDIQLDPIRRNFNQSVEKLQEALVAFSENAATIETGSKEIRSAADDLSRRTEQQAASVEETAAALEEITTSVKDSTTRAEEAGALVARTKQGAEKSGEVVRNAVSAMGEIERSSQSISNIIGVIDDIAFQTNLLALNAGVEAARAGDAGKGFAVVAQEVRELAQRSANAAKEIKSLITASGDQVKRGVGLVGETGHALENIVAEVQQIDINVRAIVQAAREQSTGLQEINTAVNQMDQGTQQNAAMVEQSNAAAHTLATEVGSLANRLAQFNLGAGARAPMQAVAASAATPMARMTAPRPSPARIAPAPAASHARPAASPARALGSKLAAAFTPAAPAASGGDWEEF
ncbi:MAG: HAMP domain-containing protein [Rhizobiaceae bacterium]|nr:HAMP domain-containing protein [Rhizobiaceae bacterium]